MDMFDIDDAAWLLGRTVTGSGGEMLGTINAVYADGPGDAATFVTVGSDASGAAIVIPLAEASIEGDGVTVPYSSTLVRGAPKIDAGAELQPAAERRVHQYYGIMALPTGGGTGAGTHDPDEQFAEVGDEDPKDEGGPSVRGWDDGERG
jgi:hypothetical protein